MARAILNGNGDGKRRGRPLVRDLWATAMWDELWKVHPAGLHPRELRRLTGLNGEQLRTGAKFLRNMFHDEPLPPVVYMRRENRWYIASSWGEQTRHAIRSEYLQQSSARLQSAGQLLAQAERAFPAHARRIRKVMRNAAYLQEETEDLIHELAK